MTSTKIKSKKTKGRVAKTRCSGTLTESAYFGFIRSALRSKFLRWKPRSDALLAARISYVGDCKRTKNAYVCAICKEAFKGKEVEVDHYPRGCGSLRCYEDLPRFVENLFCEVDNLRVCCKKCHMQHTLSERAKAKEEKDKEK